MASTLDLRQLVVDRSGTKAPKKSRRRNLVTRYVIPLGVILGFSSVIAWSARESLVSSKPVTVVPVVLARAEVQQSGTPLFQAAGWVEPRPSPVMVSALAEGMVDQLLVVAGQEVKAGQPVATLVDADARIALGETEAALAIERGRACRSPRDGRGRPESGGAAGPFAGVFGRCGIPSCKGQDRVGEPSVRNSSGGVPVAIRPARLGRQEERRRLASRPIGTAIPERIRCGDRGLGGTPGA